MFKPWMPPAAAARRMALILSTLSLIACNGADAAAGSRPLRLGGYTVPLPAEVLTARAPAFVAADGSDLLFSFTSAAFAGNELGYIRLDGSGFRCLSCDSPLAGNEPQPFRDGRRVFLQQSENQSAQQQGYVIAECTPSLADCRSFVSKPVEGLGDPSSLQDRVPKLSPDEQWVLTTRIRIDGFYMLLGRLVELPDRYEVQDLRVVNPPRHTAASEMDALLRESTIYEAKAIGTDGRTMTFAATLGGSMNFDWFALDLPTGAVRRLTTDPDWDEGSQPSPGMQYFRGASARGRSATAVFGNLPRPGIGDFALMGAVFNYYLPRSLPLPIPGRERADLLRPFLLPADGSEAEGLLISSADEAQGWISNGGSGGWSADGRHILNAQRQEADPARTRLQIYTLEGARPQLAAPQPLVAPDWAVPVSAVPLRPRSLLRRIAGPAGGSALVTQQGTNLAGLFSVSYQGYSEDGCSFLDGVQIITVAATLTATLTENLRLSGCHTGSSRIDMHFADLLTRGHARSEYDGRRYEARFSLLPLKALPR